MRKKILTFLFFAAFCAFGQDAWTLEKCIEHALEHSKTLRLQIQSSIADSARWDAARSVFYPDLSASVGTSVNWQPALRPREDPTGSVNASIRSGVTLFDGRKNRNRLLSAEKNLELGDVALEQERKAIISSITRAFIQLLFAEESLKNTSEAVLLSQKQLEFQQNLQELGKATALSLTRSRAQLAKNRHSQIIAQNNFDNAVLEMKKLLELDFESEFRISPLETFAQDGDADADEKQLSPSQIFEENRDGFTEIKSARLSVETAEISHAIAKSGKTPTLSANASLSTSAATSSSSEFGKQAADRFSTSAGLTLSIPIVDNRATRTSITVAQSNLNRAKITLERTEQNIRSDIEQLVADIRSSKYRFASAREQFEAEEENMRTVEEMHNISNITAIDYASQQNNFLSAQSELTQAKYSLILSQKLLDIYLGGR